MRDAIERASAGRFAKRLYQEGRDRDLHLLADGAIEMRQPAANAAVAGWPAFMWSPCEDETDRIEIAAKVVVVECNASDAALDLPILALRPEGFDCGSHRTRRSASSNATG